MGSSSLVTAAVAIVLVCAVAPVAKSDESVISVKVSTLDGRTIEGAMNLLGETGLSLVGNDSIPQVIPLDQILAIQRINVPATTPPVAKVGLSNGTRLSIDSIIAEGSAANIRIRGGQSLPVPLKQLGWVRFRGPSAGVDPQWLGLIDRARTSDSLVIRRAGDAIDEVAGIVVGITPESVSFSLDGDTMTAPVARLEGVLFSTAGDAAAVSKEAGSVLVDDIHGSRFVAASIKAGENETIQLRLGDGVDYALPLGQIAKIELTGSVQFLATVAPVEARFVPLVKIGIAPALANQWLGPEVADGRDLILRSTSQVEYRISDGFQTLVGSVDFDSSVTAGGKCIVRLLLDGKVAWEQTLDVGDASSRGFELPIAGVRRVRFEVVNGDDGDLGDTVRLRQPRITK
jgi:hypothetical protein